MIVIKCKAKDCLHYSKGWCSVDGQVDINKNGECLDYSPLTKQEEIEILGKTK